LALVYWIMLLGGLSLVVNGMHTLMGWKSEYSVALDPERYAQFWKWPLLNLRFTGHGILVLLAGWFCRCAPKLTQLFPEAKERKPHEFDLFYLEASTWRVSFGFFALFTSFVLVTLEAYSIGVQRQWGTGTSLSITAVWIGFGLILMLLGIAWKSVSLRTAALCVFLLTTSKVYLHDLWYLHTAIRTIAFIGLGVALLFIPWLYKRYRHRLKNVQQEINQIP
ncbi:MAG: DUF2339 domain-containing protein, partial [Planctomycetaceae bacterium]|nr:DUF2339 domain-containing protein [Planctomycetaceae bacterium]